MTGRKADVVKAAHLCAEAALRLVKPGNQVRMVWCCPGVSRGSGMHTHTLPLLCGPVHIEIESCDLLWKGRINCVGNYSQLAIDS